jgi:nucleoid DNA-binding protein
MHGKGFGRESQDSVIYKVSNNQFFNCEEKEEKMNKSELVTKIAQDTSLNKKQVEDVLKSLAETIKSEVIGGGEFTLQDVGKFKVNDKPEMQRRNPRTGEMFTSPAKKVVKITPAKVLRDAVNT